MDLILIFGIINTGSEYDSVFTTLFNFDLMEDTGV